MQLQAGGQGPCQEPYCCSADIAVLEVSLHEPSRDKGSLIQNGRGDLAEVRLEAAGLLKHHSSSCTSPG